MPHFRRARNPAQADTDPHLQGQSLSITDLSLRYALPGQRFLQVLHIASLSIPAAAIVAITGPSGSGKTSLLHTLCGLLTPEAGTVQWNAVDLSRLSESARDRWRRRTVGLIFQDFHLFPGLSALQNVLLPASFVYFRLPIELKQRATALLTRVQIDTIHQAVAQMSRGEMQRVAVARALLFAPPIVLADEPTASLDAETGARVHALLLDLCRTAHSTLIMVTHDAALARQAEIRYQLVQGNLVPYQAGDSLPQEGG
jgi:putative ABC transport system ATP-binding protein